MNVFAHNERGKIIDVVRANKWAIGWIALVTTATLIIEVWDMVNK